MSDERNYNPQRRRPSGERRDVSRYAPPDSRSRRSTVNDYYGLDSSDTDRRRPSVERVSSSSSRQQSVQGRPQRPQPSGGGQARPHTSGDRNVRSRSSGTPYPADRRAGAQQRGADMRRPQDRQRAGEARRRPTGRRPSQRELRKKRIMRRIKAVLALLLVAVIAVGILAYSKYNKILDKVDVIDEDLSTNEFIGNDELFSSDDVINVLLIGIDKLEEGEENGRSDTMMLVSIDTLNGKIKLTSFMRDCWVEIPGYGMNKLNAAHSYGGTRLLIETLEYNFRVRIDKYIIANFDMFSDIVDKLGGIDIEIEQYEAEYINAVSEYQVDYGSSVHLNGEEALWYCRIRYLDSDFYRTQRQRKVMSQIISQCRESSIFKLVSIADKAAENLQTNLTKKELSKLMLRAALKYRKYEVAEFRVPAPDTCWDETINGQMVLAIDREANVSLLRDFIYGEAPSEE